MDVSQFCNLCKKPNDQMLMLACVHDPCINCAATAYAEQVHIKSQNPDIYICEVCAEQTVLDATTINELGSLAKSYVKMPTSAKTVVHSSKHKGVGSSSSPNTKKKEPSSPSKVVYYCKEHSEEEISYYCFTCAVNICPECAIHGGHKDHEVRLIKKAISEVKGEYIEVVSRIGTSQNEMTKYKDNFLRCIKETNERHSRQKNLVSREFQILRTNTMLKEKQILKNLDEMNKENIQILTSFLEDINSHYEQVAKVKKVIEGVLRKDEVLIFEDYKKIGELNEKVGEVKKQSDSIAGQISHLNTQFLQQQLKQIAQTISSLKQNIKKQSIGSSLYIKGNHSLQST